MDIIDFRARPYTKELAAAWGQPRATRLLGLPEPSVVTLDEFRRDLDANGVALAVMTGRQKVSQGRIVRGITNDYISECVQRMSGRLIGFAGIDPTTGPAAVQELRRAIEVLGLRGVAIDPELSETMPDAPAMYPIYEAAMALNVPVVITVGPFIGAYGDPRPVYNVASRMPELTIVCSHGLYPRVTEFIELALRWPNVYLELSLYQFLPGVEPIIAAAETILRNKVVYASAYPIGPLNAAKRTQALPLSPAARNALMYENAARILGVPAKA